MECLAICALLVVRVGILKGCGQVTDEPQERTPAERHAAMAWAHQKQALDGEIRYSKGEPDLFSVGVAVRYEYLAFRNLLCNIR